jgi:Na+-driven multidrug efflux pump
MFILYSIFYLDKRKYIFTLVFDRRILKQIIKISGWSMMHAFISVAPWLLFFISIEHLGKSQLAVANIIRSISTIFFVIVSSFASTTASLVSNLIGAGQHNNIGALYKKVIILGYLIGLPIIILCIIFHNTVIGIYTTEKPLYLMAYAPYIVMLINYLFALPSYVMLNVVTGIGATKTAFLFQVITIVCYLLYLKLLNMLSNIPLAIYWTVEYLFVILLLGMSLIYVRRWQTNTYNFI